MKNKCYPLVYEISDLCELLDKSTKRFKISACVEQFVDGKIKKYTFSDLRNDVIKLCSYLIKHNLANSFILLSGELSYVWLVAFFSIISVSSKAVCIDKKILDRSNSSDILQGIDLSCVISNRNYENITLLSFKKIESILKNDSCGSDFITYIPQKNLKITDKYLDNQRFCLNTKVKDPDNEIAVVLFTSGTTGLEKQVFLTHTNIADDIMGCQKRFGGKDCDRLLSFLPVHHAFELTAGILTPFYLGETVCVSRGLKYAMQDIKTYSPSLMPAVPLIAKTIQKNIQSQIRKQKKESQFKLMLKCVYIPVIGKLFQKILYKQVVSSLGGNLKTFIVGGAAVSPELQIYFKKLGFRFFYGYGITECSPVVCCSSDSPLGSVGVSIPFCDVCSINDELCVRGSVVARQFGCKINDHMEFHDDWYQTGDLGYVDKKGNVFITGRKKELIILDNGENVSPPQLEAVLGKLEGIEEVMVYASTVENRASVLAAIIQPNKDCDMLSDTDLINKYYKQINALKLPSQFKIERISIIRNNFPHTASGKVIRSETIKLLEKG